MFDAKHTETIYAIRALRDIANEQTRPLVLWIGAGASRWCGDPGGGELADLSIVGFSGRKSHMAATSPAFKFPVGILVFVLEITSSLKKCSTVY